MRPWPRKIFNIFNIDSEEITIDVEPIKDITLSDIVPEKESDIIQDYEYTRSQLYTLIKKGQSALDDIIELANATEQPRAYEVAAQMIKNVSEVTDKLLTLQEKLKNIQEPSKTANPTTVNNALFVGSTSDLQKLLKSYTNESR